MYVEIKLGEQNYTGVACGFSFEKSVAIEEVDSEEDPKLRRLLLLWPKSAFKVLRGKGEKAKEAAAEVLAEVPEQPSSPAEEGGSDGESDLGEDRAASSGEDGEASPTEEDSSGNRSESGGEGTETDGESSSQEAEAGDESSDPAGEAGEEAEEEGSEGETESGETGSEEDDEGALKAGDSVIAEYKDEMRTGVLVKVLESGVMHVKLDDDDAKYRVLDDDKVMGA